MKTTILLLLTLLTSAANAQAPDHLKWIEYEKGEVSMILGDLSEGIDMPDLSWAWNSSVACFPATQSAKFTGKHVLYGLDLPANTELEITVEPSDKNANFSLYAYEVGAITESTLVPNLSQCIRCEADHKWDRPVRGKTQDHTRTVKDILALRNPYQVVIGVVGADGLKEGSFKLKISAK